MSEIQIVHPDEKDDYKELYKLACKMFAHISDLERAAANEQRIEPMTLSIRVKQVDAENERLNLMIANDTEIINKLMDQLAAVRTELKECRQAAFENGHSVRSEEKETR